MSYPRIIRPGDEYEISEVIERETVDPDPEPEFTGEPWGESDHVPAILKRRWSEDRGTYVPIGDET